MSAGTEIIIEALQSIGVYSPLKASNPESLQIGKRVTNSMIAELQDDGIEMGCVPLKESGSELSEPLGARDAIVSLLAVRMAKYFPSAAVGNELIKSARKGHNMLKRRWHNHYTPKPKTRGTLPKGQGNKRSFRFNDPFFNEGDEISEDLTT